MELSYLFFSQIKIQFLDIYFPKRKILNMRYYIILPLLFLLLVAIPKQSFAKPSLKDMVLIKKGCFMMGTEKKFYYETDWENTRERPAHKVCLSRFYLDKYETSQKIFKR